MFIIAGISPKIKTLDATPRLCPQCGLVRAYLKREDHYFTLFFIPLFPVKKGQPVLICERCGQSGQDLGKMMPSHAYTDKAASQNKCAACGKVLQENFKYCPYCGHSLHR